MMGRLRSSIIIKMALLVLGGTSLVFAAAMGCSKRFSEQLILAEAEKNIRTLTQSLAQRVEQEFRAVAKVPETVALVLEIRPSSDKEELESILRRVVKDNREVYGAAVAFEPFAFSQAVIAYSPYFYKSGGSLAFQQLADESYDYLKKDWYRIPRLLKAPVWSDPYFDEGGGSALMITYSCPLFNRSGDGSRHFAGIVGADISLDRLTRLVDSVSVASTGYCFITSDTGTFVTHPRRELIMRESIFSLAEELNHLALRTVGRAMIREKQGFVDIGTALSREQAFLAFCRIDSPGWSVGAVVPKAELLDEIRNLQQIMVLVAAAGLIVLAVVSFLVAGSMTHRLRRIAAAADRVAEGDLDVDLSDVKSTDEIGRLARSFTHMTAGLKERDRVKDTFGRYVTREVVKRLLESKDGLKLGGENREISLIMSDLRGFTALTSTLPPEDVIKFLNRYLGRMVEIIIEHQGIIDEIIGDGILAFFGAPEPLEDHPARAVACALSMQLAMDEINALNEAEGLPHLEMGVGVNTGTVVVGNIGSEKRAKYGAVGSQVNFTGRLESFTVGGQVLISESTYGHLTGMLEVREVLRVEMKGVPGKVALYDVKAIGGPFNVHLPHRSEAVVTLSDPIPIVVYRLDSKAVLDGGENAWISALSMTSAVLVLDHEIGRWENVKIRLARAPDGPVVGDVFAKVVRISATEDLTQAGVRFTSVAPEVYAAFRRLIGRAPTIVPPHGGTGGMPVLP